VLLLLKMKEVGVGDVQIISIYIFYNLIYALSAFPAGIIADKFGLKPTYIFGLILFIIVYTGFALVENQVWYWILFALYGIYAACTEGIAKAWITNLVPEGTAGTAIGAYTGLASMAAFIASAMAGLIWAISGAAVAFGCTAAVVFLVVVYLNRIPFANSSK
jgi:MFS family permease